MLQEPTFGCVAVPATLGLRNGREDFKLKSIPAFARDEGRLCRRKALDCTDFICILGRILPRLLPAQAAHLSKASKERLSQF